MDYLVIGSNGFAQVGYPDFYEKNRIEMRVLLEYLKNNHPIPEEFYNLDAIIAVGYRVNSKRATHFRI